MDLSSTLQVFRICQVVGTWVLLWLFKYENHIEKIRTEDALNIEGPQNSL